FEGASGQVFREFLQELLKDREHTIDLLIGADRNPQSVVNSRFVAVCSGKPHEPHQNPLVLESLENPFVRLVGMAGPYKIRLAWRHFKAESPQRAREAFTGREDFR